METFLNECSLHRQFGSIDEFSEALTAVNRVLHTLVGFEIEKQIYYDPSIYYKEAVGIQSFSSCLEHLPDKSVRQLFTILLRDKLDVKDWHPMRIHETCEYKWDETDICGTSIAELAERRLRDSTGFLLNFVSIKFPNGSIITVLKHATEEASLDCIGNKPSLLDWCRRNHQLGLVTYDPNCGRPPEDCETILGRRSRFQKKTFVNQGRTVYLDRETNRYCCVDNLHSGETAHIEIFDARGEHVGEASLNGIVDEYRRDPTKRLAL